MTLRTAVGELMIALDTVFPSSLDAVVTDCLRRHAGARECDIWLADYDVATLRMLAEDGRSSGEPGTPLEDAYAGRAFLAQAPVLETAADGCVVHVPMSLRAERLGVLSVHLPAEPPHDLVVGLQQVATALAYVLPTAYLYTDHVERVRRERPLELPAELQWSLLPVRAFACPEYTVAGQILPAYEVGGDLFDYSVDPDRLTVTVIDAMGHGLAASMLSGLAISALRNGRRTGLSLLDQVRLADKVLWTQFGGEQFVTVFAMELGADGTARYISAGHPSAVVLRGGRTVALELAPQLPLGMFERSSYVEQSFPLAEGDRLLLATDGVAEARPPGGQPFGEERFEGALMATLAATPTEVTRQLVRILSDYQHGEARDDATVVCLDWRGPRPAGAGSA